MKRDAGSKVASDAGAVDAGSSVQPGTDAGPRGNSDAGVVDAGIAVKPGTDAGLGDPDAGSPICSVTCSAEATCSLVFGVLTCVCNSGFDGNGTTCFDKNECLVPSVCGLHSTCTNAPRGLYTCTCDVGYGTRAPDGGFGCFDVDECLTNNGGCDSHADCVNVEGNRWCFCNDGTSGDGVTCAQGGWLNVKPVAASAQAMAYDAARGQLVVFVNGKTWLWNGTSWRRAAATGPSERSNAMMAYDGVSQRVIMMGGNVVARGASSETWLWNGSSWAESLSPSPGARRNSAMAQLPNGRVLLFGGSGLNDTWEWDGSAWHQVADSGPDAKGGASMAYDPTGGSVILFGGDVKGGETWSWANSQWRKVSSTGPAARVGANVVFDETSRRVTLFGGGDPTTLMPLAGETWQWSGNAWAQISSAFPSRRDSAAAYDTGRHRIVAFGGLEPGAVMGDTWEFNGTTWQRTSSTSPPTPYNSVAMTYDSVRHVTVLLVKTYAAMETWEWDGAGWAKKAVGGPPLRENMAIAETGDAGVLLFGGYAGTNALSDTWAWNGTAWTQLSPATKPREREYHAMAYDPNRRVVVLTGGSRGSDETWEWSASGWSASNPIDNGGIQFHAMAYDTAHSQMVSNATNSGTFGYLWLRSGTSWSRLNLGDVGPSQRLGAALAYDISRDRAVLVGGDQSSFGFAETWEWNGGNQTWTQRLSRGPAASTTVAMAYDTQRNRMVFFGLAGETWELVP